MTAHQPTIPDGPGLYGFEARQSDDDVKLDLELVHAVCGEHLCDVQPDDTLGSLVDMASEHMPECPGPPDDSSNEQET